MNQPRADVLIVVVVGLCDGILHYEERTIVAHVVGVVERMVAGPRWERHYPEQTPVKVVVAMVAKALT